MFDVNYPTPQPLLDSANEDYQYIFRRSIGFYMDLLRGNKAIGFLYL